MWTEGSRAKVDAADFLGQRVLEVTKGTGGHAIYISFPVREVGIAEARNLADTNWRLAEDIYEPGSTQLIARAFRPLTNLDALVAAGKTQIRVLDRSERRKRLTAVWNEHGRCYDVLSGTNKPFWLRTDESPALTERLEALVAQVETALPGVLSLTNQIAVVLSNSAAMTANFSEIAAAARPAVSNLNSVTAQLNHPGALGEWLLPTNINDKLDATLAGANTNLVLLAEKLAQSLDNLAGITSNLDRQVQANTNMLRIETPLAPPLRFQARSHKRAGPAIPRDREAGKALTRTCCAEPGHAESSPNPWSGQCRNPPRINS
jgi:hypothetical protein